MNTAKSLLLALCTCVFGLPVVAETTEKLVVVADEWPPFSGSALPGNGISVDVTRAVLEHAGYSVETAILPWSRVVSGVKSGDYDIATSLFLDAEMEKFVLYSEPFFETEIRFVRKAGSQIEVAGLESLQPYSIAVGTGFLYEDAFDRADHLKKFEVTTTLQGIQMVAAGRVDLTLDSTHVVTHSIGGTDTPLAGQVEFVGPALATRQVHMAISNQHPDRADIVAAFNASLAEMRADGSLSQILKKHDLK